MNTALADVCCARLPAEGLRHLGSLRASPGVTALRAGDAVWLFWPAGDDERVRRVLAVESAELLLPRQGQWFRPGQHLPVFDVPDPSAARPLASLLFPAPVEPEVLSEPPHLTPVRPSLLRDGVSRPATALRTHLASLVRWADEATTRQMDGLLTAWCGDEVILLGKRLPLLSGQRYWGRLVLVPLGFRVDPPLDEEVLRAALRLGPEDFLLVDEEGVEVLPGDAFGPVTRAGVRLARRSPSP